MSTSSHPSRPRRTYPSAHLATRDRASRLGQAVPVAHGVRLSRLWGLSFAAALTACGASRPRPQVEPATAVPGAGEETAPALHQAAPPPPFQRTPPAFFATLVERAREDAERAAPADPPAELPPQLQNLDPAQYATIRFDPERALWHEGPGPFEVQFFHLGSHYRWPVNIYQLESVEDAEPEEVAFSRDMFRYDGVQAPPKGASLAFTGLRVHTPLNRPGHKDELIVFQGSSYWRALGRGSAYGLSGRGLALDTGEASGEEFPRFSALYLVRPEAGATSLWILARLDSQRATGAYAFRVTPGETTRVDVTARVFFREDVSVVGVAPLTSMFLFGEQHPGRFGDYRPEVHDSDGLGMQSEDGERLFRPLRNPPRTTVSELRLDSPRGFGLLQRDRDFSHYQDLVERYQDRPSAWVEPMDDWGAGAVRLLEIATELESDDNIGAFWVPDEIPPDGLELRYRVHVGDGPLPAETFGRVVSTHSQPTERGVRFVVDFDLAQATPPEPAEVQLELTASGGEVLHSGVQKNPHVQGLRATFEVAPGEGSEGVELRAYLRRGDDVLTETWSYLWQP